MICTFFFQAEDRIRDHCVTGVQTCALPILAATYARVEEGGGLQLLLGRRSYEGMLGYRNTQDSPFKEGLNNAPKYVGRGRWPSRSPGRTRRSFAMTSATPSQSSSAR